MADQPGVLVGVHALLEGHSLVGGDGVWGAVAPVPFVVRGFQCDGDVVSEQVDDVSLGRVGDRHETLRMLRNHHAHPPTRIPETARMCMPSPGLVVRGGHESAPGTSGIDDAELRTFQMASLCRLRAVWLSKNEAVSLGDAWGQRGMGNPVAWLPNRAVDLRRRNQRA